MSEANTFPGRETLPLKLKYGFGEQLGVSRWINGCPSMLWYQIAFMRRSSRHKITLLEPISCLCCQQNQPSDALHTFPSGVVGIRQ